MTQTLLGLALISQVTISPQAVTPSAYLVDQAVTTPIYMSSAYLVEPVLARNVLDLTTRLPSQYGSQVFADNILLALHYLKGDEGDFKLDPEKPYHPANMDWEHVREPFEISFTLEPGEVFAYHENVLPEFDPPSASRRRRIVTMNSRFYIQEGYKSLAGLGGNGVCHLASLINWVASEAGLEVTAKANHNFAPISGVPKEYGTSIRYAETGHNSQNQNLYVKNGFEEPVTFEFEADSQKVILTITK